MKKTWIMPLAALFSALFLTLSGCASDTQTDTAAPTPPAEADLASGSREEANSRDTLHVYYLDIGQGDCAVLTLGEHAMLIDAGDNDKGTAVQSYLQYLGIDTLDYAVLTHPDADHIGGADVVLYKFDCGTILMPDIEADTRTYDDVIQAMNSKGESAVHPSAGDVYEFGDASFTILGPVDTYEDNNNNSIVLRLDYGDTSFLFTGDAEETAESDILASGADVDADVLKVGHHGSSSSTSDAFLAAVSPEYAVISCAEGNSYGHPHTETMIRLRQNGITVYRTDEQGTIVAESDGQEITWSSAPSDSWQSGEPTGSSGGADTDTAAPSAQDQTTYVLNTNTMKFHTPDCGSVADISPQNRETTSQTREEVMAEGYEPCGRCNP